MGGGWGGPHSATPTPSKLIKDNFRTTFTLLSLTLYITHFIEITEGKEHLIWSKYNTIGLTDTYVEVGICKGGGGLEKY